MVQSPSFSYTAVNSCFISPPKTQAASRICCGTRCLTSVCSCRGHEFLPCGTADHVASLHDPGPRIVPRRRQPLNRFDNATAFSPGVLQIEPRHHLEPDLLVVPNTALPREFRLDAKWTQIRKWWLAVEVSGVGSEVYDRDFKGPAYPALGVLEYWRVDLRESCLFVSRRDGPSEEPHRDRVTWVAPGQSAPVEISVPDLFR